MDTSLGVKPAWSRPQVDTTLMVVYTGLKETWVGLGSGRRPSLVPPQPRARSAPPCKYVLVVVQVSSFSSYSFSSYSFFKFTDCWDVSLLYIWMRGRWDDFLQVSEVHHCCFFLLFLSFFWFIILLTVGSLIVLLFFFFYLPSGGSFDFFIAVVSSFMVIIYLWIIASP